MPTPADWTTCHLCGDDVYVDEWEEHQDEHSDQRGQESR